MPNDQTMLQTEQSNRYQLAMRLLEGRYSVCRLLPSQTIPSWAVSSDWFSITKTGDELSIVCPQDVIPENITCETEWRIIKVEGPLDFGLTGILAEISSILARKQISIFAISTYDTDYILVKEHNVTSAIQALIDSGYRINH